jgi:hypothetical protein
MNGKRPYTKPKKSDGYGHKCIVIPENDGENSSEGEL